MRAVCQRVKRAHVTVDGELVGAIGAGWMVLLGVGPNDDEATAVRMADKLVVLSMMGMTPEDIEGTIREQLARTGARVIFTDLPAGIWTRAGSKPPDLI